MKKQMQIGTLPILSILLMASLPGPIFGQASGVSGPGSMSGGGRPGMGMGGDMGMESMEGMEFTLRPSLSYTVDDKPYRATRVRSFHYVFQSFRPKELANSDGGMGGYGGGAATGSGGFGMSMGASGMFGGYPGGSSSAGYPGSGIYASGSSLATNRLAINIHAYMFDGEKTNERTRIELMIEQPNGMGMDGMAGAGGLSGGPGGMGGMDSAASAGGMGMPSGPSQMQPFASLGISKGKDAAFLLQGPGGATQVLSQSEIKLVTEIICQTIWKADVVKALFASKGQGDSAKGNETFLKQLLAEQYDTQLARQEMEAESIKRRLDQLQDELKRRKLAKDRVVEVQLGRLILDAQGLLNNER